VNVVGNLAYIARGGAGLQIVDVSDPAAPVAVGGFDLPYSASDVDVVDNFAYVVNGAGLYVLDVSDPAAPVAVGSFDV
jgi:hypothetical protein